MYLPVIILILVVAVALILIVMVQNPKGGGLSSAFGGGANTIGGVQNTNTFLDKATWFLAIAMFVLILASNFVIERKEGVNTTHNLNKTLKDVKTEAPAPVKTTTPATEKKAAE